MRHEILNENVFLKGYVFLTGTAEPVKEGDPFDFEWTFSMPEDSFNGTVKFKVIEYHLDRTFENIFEIEAGEFDLQEIYS